MPIYEVNRTARVYSDEPLEEQDAIEAAATSTDGLSFTVTDVTDGAPADWMQDLVDHTDWVLLRAQKARLVDIQGRLADPEVEAAPVQRVGGEVVDDFHTIEGLLNLLDALMDGAARDLGEQAVFGRDPDQ